VLSKKVCLLGDCAVGKTNLARRFVYDLFSDRYLSASGVKVSCKTVVIPHAHEPVELTIMLWDLAASEEFSRVQASYLRGAAGAVLVCDLTRPQTLDRLRAYADHLLQANPAAHLVLAANKRDLVGRQQLTPEHIATVAASLQAACYLTSAKTGEEVESLFRHLGRLLVASS